MDNGELQKKHFAALKEKYQVNPQAPTRSESFLYLILRKAELGIPASDLEFQWLQENHLFKTIDIVFLQQYQTEEQKRLETDCLRLRSNYRIPEDLELPISSPIYSILWKADSGSSLTGLELKLLDDHGLVDTLNLIQNALDFSS